MLFNKLQIYDSQDTSILGIMISHLKTEFDYLQFYDFIKSILHQMYHFYFQIAKF